MQFERVHFRFDKFYMDAPICVLQARSLCGRVSVRPRVEFGQSRLAAVTSSTRAGPTLFIERLDGARPPINMRPPVVFVLTNSQKNITITNKRYTARSPAAQPCINKARAGAASPRRLEPLQRQSRLARWRGATGPRPLPPPDAADERGAGKRGPTGRPSRRRKT